MTTTTTPTYTVELRRGWSGVDHLVEPPCGTYETLEGARAAIRSARRQAGHPRAGEPRLDVVRSDGTRYEWE